MELTGKKMEGSPSTHSFHIPVLGTGFTIDTPLRVAKYGISSVISLGDDILIEQMRKFHCEKEGEPYEEISINQEDARARRITAYLDLVNRLVQGQVEVLQASPFEAGSEITRYFDLLPNAPLKRAYQDMLAAADPEQKVRMQDELRRLAVPGSIDVNIMAKVDRSVFRDGKKLPDEFCTALAALRGYAKSSLWSSVIFSAGMNRRLYGYVDQFDDFFPNADGVLKKKIVLKVSDYRSAVVQGKFFAKRGLWVSEYRIESGLNCGGHAFATKGLLLGPILEEFRQKKRDLYGQLHAIYVKALGTGGRTPGELSPELRVTVQGGIGTSDENEFLLNHYDVDATGWATPFLLVPEVTNVERKQLAQLEAATDSDVYLSNSSPFGIPFWNLRNSASEEARRGRIQNGKPGIPCSKGYLRFNTDLSKEPVCTASRTYQGLRLQRLSEEELPAAQVSAVWEQTLAKSCLCRDLASGATMKHGIDPDATPAVCPGPNIVNFSKIYSLEEMVSHIYGRIRLFTNPDRPHMFIREIKLYVEYLEGEMERFSLGLLSSTPTYFREFKENLLQGIEYYRHLTEQLAGEVKDLFLDDLDALRKVVESSLASSAKSGQNRPGKTALPTAPSV